MWPYSVMLSCLNHTKMMIHVKMCEIKMGSVTGTYQRLQSVTNHLLLITTTHPLKAPSSFQLKAFKREAQTGK